MSKTMSIVYMNYDDIQAKMGDNLEANTVYLVADNESDSAKIKSKTKELGYSGSTEEVIGEQMIVMSDIVTAALTGISAISLVVSSIMILIVLNISVVERTKEIGLLRAIGARSKDIKRIFVSEAFLIGTLSGIIGLVTAYVISVACNTVSMSQFDVNLIDFTPFYAFVGMAVSVGVSVLAGLLPAKKAAKLDPVDSLRTE